MESASSCIPNDSLSIIAVLSIEPIGLAIPFPAMSGALPCIGSYRLTLLLVPELPGRLDRLADGGLSNTSADDLADAAKKAAAAVGGKN